MIATSPRLSDFHYDLPVDRIAQKPVEPRDHSKLMVVNTSSRQFEHRAFFDLDQMLVSGDVLVANATRVFPARLRGKKKTGGKVEVLLLGRSVDPSCWRALVRGATQVTELFFEEGTSARMEKRLAEEEWLLRFSRDDVSSFLQRQGETPLPPYIKRPQADALDMDRYQTVYAKSEGAVAAPTAGFHFTPELLARLKQRSIQWQEIVLHVGWGTFRPVREEDIQKHQMLPESYDMTSATAETLNTAHREKRRIIAVGTTAVRTLETVCDEDGVFQPGQGESRLFITPGYTFKAIDALITNFHLPDATPLFLASAFYSHKTRDAEPFGLRAAYEEAIRSGYRFYSYGDAMLIQ
ncbi:MAG: tRNA preQ1(34) S-adenosylmethionine ribosyltransferase-isomerase QueA [Elusimicrobiota bacterium]|jgi:S-adenosylmethionine:tRNA ribosyltransferase-isomerase